MGSAPITGSIDLCWQPVVYRTGAAVPKGTEARAGAVAQRRRLRTPLAANAIERLAPRLARLTVR
jgi:hypothetical protein